MSTAKKCYNCFTDNDANSEVCKRCGVKLGPATPSGQAARPSSPLPKFLLAVLALGVCGFGLNRLYSEKTAAVETVTVLHDSPAQDRDAVLRGIREKGAAELSKIGVADIGYEEDAFCVYVDQRFANLSSEQQQQVIALVAGEWKRSLGRATTAVKVLKYGTGDMLASLTI